MTVREWVSTYRKDLLWLALTLLLGGMLVHIRLVPNDAAAIVKADRAFLDGSKVFHRQLASRVAERDAALADAARDQQLLDAALADHGALDSANAIANQRPPETSGQQADTALQSRLASFSAENVWLRRQLSHDSVTIADALRVNLDLRAALRADTLALNIAVQRADSAERRLTITANALDCRILFVRCPSRALAFILGAVAIEGAHLATKH